MADSGWRLGRRMVCRGRRMVAAGWGQGYVMPCLSCLCSQPPTANRYHLAAPPRWVGAGGGEPKVDSRARARASCRCIEVGRVVPTPPFADRHTNHPRVPVLSLFNGGLGEPRPTHSVPPSLRASRLSSPSPSPNPSPLTIHLCTFAQELRSDLHLCTVSLSSWPTGQLINRSTRLALAACHHPTPTPIPTPTPKTHELPPSSLPRRRGFRGSDHPGRIDRQER